MTPKVSVIVPAYNAQNTLGDTLSSVLAQTMGDLEVLVVDDGSTDGTWDLLQQWRQADPQRIHALQHPAGVNRGVSATRNLALDRARGGFVAFLDADDAWVPHKLQRQLLAFERLPEHVGVVFSNAWFVREEPARVWPDGERWLPQRAGEMDVLFAGSPGSTIEQLLFQPPTDFRNCVMSPTPLVRASYFADGLRFIGPPRLSTQFEDYLMWLMLALRCEFVALQEPLAYYRVHETQFVSRYVRRARCLNYLQHNADVLSILEEEDGDLLRRFSFEERVSEKFLRVMAHLLRNYQPSAGLTIKTVSASDVLPLMIMGARYGSIWRITEALALRFFDATMHRLLRANRLASLIRAARKRNG